MMKSKDSDDKRQEVEGTEEYLPIRFLSKIKPLSFKERLFYIKHGIRDGLFRTHYNVIDIGFISYHCTRTLRPLKDRVRSTLISLLVAVRGWVLEFGKAKLLPVIRVQDFAEGEKLPKEEEFIPPSPSWLYKCLQLWLYSMEESRDGYQKRQDNSISMPVLRTRDYRRKNSGDMA